MEAYDYVEMTLYRNENNKPNTRQFVGHVNINTRFSNKLSDWLEHCMAVRIVNKTSYTVVYNISLSKNYPLKYPAIVGVI